MPGLSSVVQIVSSTHAEHFLASRADGSLVGWGSYTVGGPPVAPYHPSPGTITIP